MSSRHCIRPGAVELSGDAFQPDTLGEPIEVFPTIPFGAWNPANELRLVVERAQGDTKVGGGFLRRQVRTLDLTGLRLWRHEHPWGTGKVIAIVYGIILTLANRIVKRSSFVRTRSFPAPMKSRVPQVLSGVSSVAGAASLRPARVSKVRSLWTLPTPSRRVSHAKCTSHEAE